MALKSSSLWFVQAMTLAMEIGKQSLRSSRTCPTSSVSSEGYGPFFLRTHPNAIRGRRNVSSGLETFDSSSKVGEEEFSKPRRRKLPGSTQISFCTMRQPPPHSARAWTRQLADTRQGSSERESGGGGGGSKGPKRREQKQGIEEGFP